MFTIIDLCLLCLKNNTNLKNILTKDSDGVILKEKLHYFLLEQTQIEREVSLYICVSCLEKLNTVYNYKLLCLHNIGMFNNFIHSLKSANEPYRKLQVTLIDIKNLNLNPITSGNEINSDAITTEDCKLEYPHKHKPEVITKILGEENIKVEFINFSDSTEINKAQEESVVKEEMLITLDMQKTEENNEMKYSIISHKLENSKAQEEMIKYEFVDDLVKEESQINFDIDKSELLQIDNYRMQCNNEDIEPQIYNEGNKSFKCDTNTNLKGHEDNRPLKCTICNKGFIKNCNLIRHMRVHTGKKPYECNLCNKTYPSSSEFAAHKSWHTGEQPYECNLCNKTYTSSSDFAAHKSWHKGEQPYECNLCNKTYTSSSEFAAHKSWHTGEQPFKCDLCNKAFFNKTLLVAHRLIHTGEKPFKCDVCHKGFRYKATLVRHYRFHTGEKPFKCNICGETFSQTIDLAHHIQNHTGEGPYKCKVCSKTFSQKSNLKAHKCGHQTSNEQKVVSKQMTTILDVQKLAVIEENNEMSCINISEMQKTIKQKMKMLIKKKPHQETTIQV